MQIDRFGLELKSYWAPWCSSAEKRKLVTLLIRIVEG